MKTRNVKRSVDSGISVETNSDSSTGSGDELVNPKETPKPGICLLPFSPLKEQRFFKVAVPMFPNHKCTVNFSPPVSSCRLHRQFDCDDKMAELLSRLPDYEEFQPEIVRSIYVAHQSPKRQSYHTTTKNTPASTAT